MRVCQSTGEEEGEYVEGNSKQTHFSEFLWLHEVPGLDKLFNEIVSAWVSKRRQRL